VIPLDVNLPILPAVGADRLADDHHAPHGYHLT
jgi:hypothetical protein